MTSLIATGLLAGLLLRPELARPSSFDGGDRIAEASPGAGAPKRASTKTGAAEKKWIPVGQQRTSDDLQVDIESVLAGGLKSYTSDTLLGGTFRGWRCSADKKGESIVVLRMKIRGPFRIESKNPNISVVGDHGGRLDPACTSVQGKGQGKSGDYPFILPDGTTKVDIVVGRAEPITVSLTPP